MRKGFDDLTMLVQEKLRRDPFGGQIFVFRGRRGYLLKALWWDGQGLCLFAKRLKKGPLRLAVAGGWHCRSHAGATRNAVGGYRLADAGAHLASGSGRFERDFLTQDRTAT